MWRQPKSTSLGMPLAVWKERDAKSTANAVGGRNTLHSSGDVQKTVKLGVTPSDEWGDREVRCRVESFHGPMQEPSRPSDGLHTYSIVQKILPDCIEVLFWNTSSED
jgi:hypothetical protein